MYLGSSWFLHASPATLRVAKSIDFDDYVTYSHDQIHLRLKRLHLPIVRIYNNCALRIYTKLKLTSSTFSSNDQWRQNQESKGCMVFLGRCGLDTR